MASIDFEMCEVLNILRGKNDLYHGETGEINGPATQRGKY